MNKNILTISAIVIMSVPGAVAAQTLIDTTAATGIGGTVDATSAQVPLNVRQKVQAQYGSNMQNVKANQETRNTMVGKPIQATNPNKNVNPGQLPPMVKNMRTNLSPEEVQRLASTTRAEALKRQTIQRTNAENVRTMRVEQYQNRKEYVVRHFKIAVNNLLQIRERISARIEKEKQNGRDMSKAVTLLSTADTKITSAKQAVANLEAYLPTASTTSQSVDLEKTRQMIRTAQDSIRSAKNALNDVVVAIAHAMGWKAGQNRTASTTASSTATPVISPASQN